MFGVLGFGWYVGRTGWERKGGPRWSLKEEAPFLGACQPVEEPTQPPTHQPTATRPPACSLHKQVRTALSYHIRVVVPCYREPLEVIQKTVTAALVAPIPSNCSRTGACAALLVGGGLVLAWGRMCVWGVGWWWWGGGGGGLGCTSGAVNLLLSPVSPASHPTRLSRSVPAG